MSEQKRYGQRIGAIVGSLLGLLVLTPMAFADADSAAFRDLSAEWWQWAYSIPASHNPVLDTTGTDCMVGQRGDRWFLAGSFSGTAERTCTIPEGVRLFFPVINTSQFDSPNECGQNATSLSLAELRANAAAFIDGVTAKAVTVDDTPIRPIRRVKSTVFEVALPEENVFTFFGITPCDAGVYSPTVDEGYYVEITPLPVGAHTLHIQATVPGFAIDVTYHLTVAPVTK